MGPFTKWGFDFMMCNLVSTRGYNYIIVIIEYFTKWEEAMPTFKDDGKTTTYFLFNQIVPRFDIPKKIVTDHGSQIHNSMMTELTTMLRFRKDHSSSFYP